jgi:ABC transport permease subunit
VLAWIEQWTKRAVLEVQEYVLLCIAVARGSVTRPFYWRDVVEQFEAIGVGSITVVVLTGLFTGAVLALQSGVTLDQFGARSEVGRLVGASMIKELGPVLTALMVTGRVGSGIAAELGAMAVTEQLDALRALGTDPIRKLAVPRVLAGTLMVPALTTIADAVGMTGAWSTGARCSWASTCRTCGWDSSSPSSWGSSSSPSGATSGCGRPGARGASAGQPPAPSSPRRWPCWPWTSSSPRC